MDPVEVRYAALAADAMANGRVKAPDGLFTVKIAHSTQPVSFLETDPGTDATVVGQRNNPATVPINTR